jgi:peptide/nickel transport system permease protein
MDLLTGEGAAVGRYLIRRLVTVIPVILLVTALVFLLQFLSPGDPITMLVPLDEVQHLSPQDLQAIRHQYGLDRPIYIQYGDWLWHVAQGDLGRSLRSRERVTAIIGERLPVTMELATLSLLVSVLVAIPAGIIAARRRNSVQDLQATGLSVTGVSIPNFWLALLLILLFSVFLGWLPPSGFVPLSADPRAHFVHLILPVLTLSAALMARTMRLTRSSMLEVLRQEYVTTARAKGLRESVVVRRHALKNALIPVVVVIGLQFGALLGGTLIIEQLFAIPGIGKAAVDAVFGKDFPVVQGIVLLAVVVRIATNIIADIIAASLDPRIRFQ